MQTVRGRRLTVTRCKEEGTARLVVTLVADEPLDLVRTNRIVVACIVRKTDGIPASVIENIDAESPAQLVERRTIVCGLLDQVGIAVAHTVDLRSLIVAVHLVIANFQHRRLRVLDLDDLLVAPYPYIVGRVILAPVQHCPGPDDLVTSAVYHRQHQILITRGYLRAVLVAVYRRTRSRRFDVQVKASVYGHIARPGDVYS